METEDEGPLDSFDVVPVEVANQLQRTKPHCALGPDDISTWMLRSILSPSIASMFNMSIQLGKTANHMERVPCCANSKDSSKHVVSSYRPLSLLSMINKCLGHLLLEYSSSNNLLSNDHFGFHARQSSVMPLLLAIHQCHKKSSVLPL